MTPQEKAMCLLDQSRLVRDCNPNIPNDICNIIDYTGLLRDMMNSSSIDKTYWTNVILELEALSNDKEKYGNFCPEYFEDK